MLHEGKIDIIMFFGNPNKAAIKDSWFEHLINTAVNEDIVVAYNQSTIDMLLTSIAINDNNPDENKVPPIKVNYDNI